MRPFYKWCAALLSAVAVLTPVRAADLRYFDDAALHAVQFIEDGGEYREGWAVGDDGVVWHSLDGGKNWERQPTGVRASLRSLHFLTPQNGWIAGREELPNGTGSVGVLLYTKDGGLSWQRVLLNAMPGLNVVRFVDAKTGFVAGDGAEQYPAGVFKTEDGGRTWQPVPGPRCPSWFAACFTPGAAAAPLGSLFGGWNRMAKATTERIAVGENDTLGGRTLHGVHLNGKRGFAVGDGGLVLTGECGGSSWDFFLDLKLPEELKASWDFHAIGGSGNHFWIAGRPGSIVLHTPDAGRTWEWQRTGCPLPLHGVYFGNEKTGWAVGELGTILGTTDGGKTWQLQRRGGQRAAALFVHAHSAGLPVDTVALLGGQDGYLTTALRVTAPDPSTAALDRVTEATRFALAHRQAGGAAAEALWQFPISSTLARANREELVKTWNKLHGDRAAEQLLRQLVLAVRMWRPEVIVTDHASAGAAEALVAEALREAFDRAADPKQFPEQLTLLGLEPWKASKLYGCVDSHTNAHVVLDLTTPSGPLQASVRDFATGPAGLLTESAAVVPTQRCFRLVAEHMEGAALHKELMQGLNLPPGGPARRVLRTTELDRDLVKAIRQRETLRALSEGPASPLTEPSRLLAQIDAMTQDMPPDLAAAAIHGAASQYVRIGQWEMAREIYLLLADRYPAHPLTIDALRWLIRHNASSEARRRSEMGQFLVLKMEQSTFTSQGQTLNEAIEKAPGHRSQSFLNSQGQTPNGPAKNEEQGHETKPQQEGSDAKTPPVEVRVPSFETRKEWAEFSLLTSKATVRKWYQGCLDMETRLLAFGPMACNDPTLQFPLQAARRNLGQFDEAQQWYSQFASRQPDGPWRNAALAELWLTKRSGSPPKPVAVCRFTDVKPFLDGKLDDACWQTGEPLRLRDASEIKAKPGEEPKPSELDAKYQTEVRLAYDREYLYLAARCTHPEDPRAGAGSPRAGAASPDPALLKKRDGDLRNFDRVSLMLDLDRDYSTCFHLQVDERGCISDDCWGDKSWDPRWFVAVHRETTAWTVEAAIPLKALTGDPVAHGHAWACNVVRVVPGAGVQSFSQPAEVPEEAMRLEGMGLLMFMQETHPVDATRRMPPAQP
jgi:photosystem II stability/assembly factor-like uncharacterized protein